MRYQTMQQNGVMQPTALPTGMPYVTLYLTACRLYIVAIASLTPFALLHLTVVNCVNRRSDTRPIL